MFFQSVSKKPGVFFKMPYHEIKIKYFSNGFQNLGFIKLTSNSLKLFIKKVKFKNKNKIMSLRDVGLTGACLIRRSTSHSR